MAKWRNRLLLIDMEGTYGTAPSLDGTDALLVSEIDVTPLEVELVDRELITGYFGNTEKVVGARMSRATFSVELAGSGAAGTAPKYGKVLRACGFDETIIATTSVTYDPISDGHESVAIAFHAEGTLHVMRGARGTLSFDCATGAIPKINFELTCLYTAASSATFPTATFTDQKKPLAFNSQNTTNVSIFGYAACLEGFTLDLANEVVFRQNAGCSENVQITERKPSGTIKIEAPVRSVKDYFANIAAQTLGEVEFTHGDCDIILPSCNLGTAAYSDSDGILMLDIPIMPNPIDGNDEMQFVFTG
jgi:hypothetical protein